MTHHTKKIIKGTGIVFAMMILTSGLGYLFRMMLAKELSLEDYGLFFSVFSFLSMFFGFKQLGTGAAFVRFVSEFRAKNQLSNIKKSLLSFIIIQLAIFGLIAFGILILSVFLTESYFKTEKAFWTIIILVLAFFPTIFISSFRGVLQGFQNMTSYASIEFFQSLFLVVFSFIFLNIGFGHIAPALAYVFSYFIVAIWAVLLVRKIFPFFRIKSIPDKLMFIKLIKFGIPIIIAITANSIFGSIDTMVLTLFRSLEDVALFNLAQPTANLLQYVPKAIAITIFPVSAELFFTNKQKLSQSLNSLYKYLFMIGIPLCLIMLSFSDEILSILFGDKYIGASSVLRVLSVAMLFSTIYIVNQQILLGIDKPKLYTVILIAGAIFNIIFDLLLVPVFGVMGAAFANLISFLIMMSLSLVFINRFIKLNIPYLAWTKTAICGVVMVGLIVGLKSLISLNIWLELGIISFFAMITYCAGILLFRLVTFKELIGLIDSTKQ